MLSYLLYLNFDYHFINFGLTIALEPHFEDEDFISLTLLHLQSPQLHEGICIFTSSDFFFKV